MMRRLTTIMALALAACVLPALPADATKVPGKSREAWFKASVQGVQTTTWAVDHDSTGQLCDYSEKGSGSERVVFKSRPVQIRAFQTFGIGPVYLLGRRGLAILPARGNVTRHGSLARSGFNPGCGVGDGGGGSGPQQGPDCGRKRIKSLPLRLAFDTERTKRVTLRNEGKGSPDFERCPVMGESWTNILQEDKNGRSIGEELPASDLFDRGQGKMLVIGKGATHHSDPVADSVSTTRIEWTLTLVRLRR